MLLLQRSLSHTFIFIRQAPKGVGIPTVMATTVVIVAGPPDGNPDIGSYEASVVGGNNLQKCTIQKSDNPPQCILGLLSPNTDYTFSLKACMPSSFGCGESVTRDAKTLPQSKFVGLRRHMANRKMTECSFVCSSPRRHG